MPTQDGCARRFPNESTAADRLIISSIRRASQVLRRGVGVAAGIEPSAHQVVGCP